MSRLRLSALATLGLCAFVLLFPRATAQEPAQPTAERAWAMLKEGNERFAKDALKQKDVGAKVRVELAKGQHPFAIVLTCADSRLSPEIIFNQGLGDIFVLRVAGNIADPFVLGSIEYAVEHFHTPLIVVLGHDKCGAVAAVLDKVEVRGNVEKLAKEIYIGKDLPKEREKALPLAITNNIIHATVEMTKKSDVIKKHIEEKKVRVVSGVYRLASGKVEWLEGNAPK